MSLIFPKKEILYAPMLGTLGGGSARGFGRGIGGGGNPFADPFSFTAAGLTGFNGPTTSDVLSHYVSSASAEQYAVLSDSSQFSVQNGNQQLTISAEMAGNYRVTMRAPAGAAGHNTTGGLGGQVSADFTLQETDVVWIVVGQQGRVTHRSGSTTQGTSSGGSGGSTLAVNRTGVGFIHIASAGGGGSGGYDTGNNGENSVYETTITQARGWAMNVSNPTQRDPNGGSGGAGYRGGGGGGGAEYGSSGAGGYFGDGGDGGYGAYYPSSNGGNGGDANHTSYAHGGSASGGSVHSGSRGRSFFNWSYGGGASASTGYNNGYPPEGGFGGGGSGGLGNNAGGSGGGYSGGGGLGHSNGSDNEGGRCGTTYVGSNATLVSGSFTTHSFSTGNVQIQAL